MKRLAHYWNLILVWLGIKQWVIPEYHRPKYQMCAYHNRKMKRGKVTEWGAFYRCSLCRRDYHLEGGKIEYRPMVVK